MSFQTRREDDLKSQPLVISSRARGKWEISLRQVIPNMGLVVSSENSVDFHNQPKKWIIPVRGDRVIVLVSLSEQGELDWIRVYPQVLKDD
jgi:hypothetical protein